MTVSAQVPTSRRAGNPAWPWVLIASGVLFVIGGSLHPNEDSSLPDPEATAGAIGTNTWIPAHGLLLVSAIGFLIGLFALVRSDLPLPSAARRAAWVATVGAGLYAVEGVFHLAAFADEDALLAGEATPFLSTHLTMGLVVYPLFTFAVAALAVLSRGTLTHPAIGVLGAIGAVIFGVAPALVGLADIEALGWMFPVGGILMALWFTAVGVTALARGSARREGVAAS
ncbi:MAG: hypothetical protein WKF51_13915 [Geodermatophilaceae bacterium]